MDYSNHSSPLTPKSDDHDISQVDGLTDILDALGRRYEVITWTFAMFSFLITVIAVSSSIRLCLTYWQIWSVVLELEEQSAETKLDILEGTDRKRGSRRRDTASRSSGRNRSTSRTRSTTAKRRRLSSASNSSQIKACSSDFVADPRQDPKRVKFGPPSEDDLNDHESDSTALYASVATKWISLPPMDPDNRKINLVVSDDCPTPNPLMDYSQHPRRGEAKASLGQAKRPQENPPTEASTTTVVYALDGLQGTQMHVRQDPDVRVDEELIHTLADFAEQQLALKKDKKRAKSSKTRQRRNRQIPASPARGSRPGYIQEAVSPSAVSRHVVIPMTPEPDPRAST